MAKYKYQEWLQKENLIKLSAWARNGLTYEQIAKNMGIARSTLNVWKNQYSDISDALKKGKDVADFEVENAMHKAACGYFVEETETYITETGGIQTKRIKKNKKWITPNTAAQIFWLKNRKPDAWRDAPDEEVGENEVVNVIVEAARRRANRG